MAASTMATEISMMSFSDFISLILTLINHSKIPKSKFSSSEPYSAYWGRALGIWGAG